MENICAHLSKLDSVFIALFAAGLLDHCPFVTRQVVGHGLKTLHLVHVDEIDRRVVATISIFCPILVKFGLINCEFVEIRGAVDEQGWEIRQGGFQI